MHIQKINSTPNFNSQKRRFLDIESHEQLVDVLNKMSRESKLTQNDTYWYLDKVAKVELKNEKNSALYDTRYDSVNIDKNKQIIGKSRIEIGDSILTIDNKTGEIVECEKPFYRTWKKLLKKANSFLVGLNAGFHNPDSVNKTTFRITGMKIQKLLKK